MKLRGVLGTFDGMSCGQIALERAGIEYETYYASEIDFVSYNNPQNHWLVSHTGWSLNCS